MKWEWRQRRGKQYILTLISVYAREQNLDAPHAHMVQRDTGCYRRLRDTYMATRKPHLRDDDP